MNAGQKIFGSLVTDFIIAGGGSVLVVVADAGGEPISTTAFIVAGIVGLVSAAKGFKTYLAEPPK